MTATLPTSWRSERLFGMPACAAAEGFLGRGAGMRGDLGLRGLVSFDGSAFAGLSSDAISENYQVKPAVQPTHNPVGAPSS